MITYILTYNWLYYIGNKCYVINIVLGCLKINMAEIVGSCTVGKHCGEKGKELVTSISSFSTIFSKAIPCQGGLDLGLFGEGFVNRKWGKFAFLIYVELHIFLHPCLKVTAMDMLPRISLFLS